MADRPRDKSPEAAPGPTPAVSTEALGTEPTEVVTSADDTDAWTPPPAVAWDEITVRTTLQLPESRTAPADDAPTAETLRVLESTAGSATEALEWRSVLADDAGDTLPGVDDAPSDTRPGGDDGSSGQGLAAVGAAVTHAGLVREGNEDAFLVWPEVNLAVVADGMGGHQAGEVASALAVEHIRESLVSCGAVPDTLHAQMVLVQAIREANDRITALADEDADLRGMGTTVVALWMIGHKGLVVHVGDSRLYRIRGGRLQQMTQDHSLLNELLKHGIMSAAQAETDPRRHVLTRALGSRQELDVESTVLDLRAGDRYLLCTDGLTDIVDDAVIRVFAGPPRAPVTAARVLVEAALANGGKDNVTVVVIAVEPV